MSSIEALLRNNAAHAASFRGSGLAAPPSGRIAVVTCMDARVDPAALLGLEPGQAHVIRNAGGVVTDDVLRSLSISQVALGTREIMLIRHTDCGMLKFTDAQLGEAIQARAGASPAFPLRTFTDLDGELRHSIASIVESPILAHREAVRGFIYDVESGALREVV